MTDMTGEQLLGKAGEALADRMKRYGHPKDGLKLAAWLWEGVLETQVAPSQVALCMILLKIARLEVGGHHDDSAIDIAGYAAVYQEIARQNGKGGPG